MPKINQLVGVNGYIYRVLAQQNDWIYVGLPGRVYPGYWRPYGSWHRLQTHQWVKANTVRLYQ